MSPVARLKKTWNKVNTDKFEILEVRIIYDFIIAFSSYVGLPTFGVYLMTFLSLFFFFFHSAPDGPIQ